MFLYVIFVIEGGKAKRCVELSKEELIKKLEEKIDWIKTTYCPKYNYSAIDYGSRLD